MEPKIKACGYIRVSSAIQVSEGESLDTQRKQIEDFIQQRGWILTEIYADEGATGTKIEYRTDFQRMIHDAEDGKFNAIVFTKLSRFARNARDYQNRAFELGQHNVQLISIKENIDPTTKIGKMIAGILALFAEWEHETIREQMFENKMIRWREKRSFIGQLPFGYHWNNQNKTIEITESEAEIYRKIVNMYINQGMSFLDIAIRLEADGLTYTRVKKDGTVTTRIPWKRAGISYLLKNPAYYGHYVVNQYKYEDGKRGAGTHRTNERKAESEAITWDMPAIITKTEWDKVQATSAFRKIKTKRSNDESKKSFLRNVCVCGRCGGKLNAQLGYGRKEDSNIRRYYKCYWATTSKRVWERKRGSEIKCTLPHIKADVIEKAVWADILVMFSLNPKKAFGDVFNKEKYAERITELKNSISKFESDLKIKTRARDRLFKLLDEEDIDDEVSTKLRKNKDEMLTIKSQLSTLNERLLELESLQAEELYTYEFFESNKKLLSEIRKEIRNLDMPDRMLLVESMLVGPVKVDFQEPDDESFGGPFAEYKLRFNPDIIQRFADEGKITLLNTDSRNDLSILAQKYCSGNVREGGRHGDRFSEQFRS